MSLVNLVMSLGIGVEFCAHLVHAFLEEKGGSEERAAAAVGDVGAAVLSGITLTKVTGERLGARVGVPGRAWGAGGLLPAAAAAAGSRRFAARHGQRSLTAPAHPRLAPPLPAGVCVLAFSRTRIFDVYYFRMYAALVVLGAAHGLVLLPVLLAAFGPEELEVRRRCGGVCWWVGGWCLLVVLMQGGGPSAWR